MGKGIVDAAVSLDGYVADKSGGVGPLFDYYFNGDVEGTLGDPDRIFRVTAPTAGYLHRFATANLGCVVISMAKDFAGNRDVSVNAGNTGGQAIEAGLVDQVHLNLVPVLFGSGVKFFGDHADGLTSVLHQPGIAGQRSRF